MQQDILTEADKQFQSLVAEGKSPEKASYEVFPNKADPLKYALAKIHNKDFVRANYHMLLQEAGFTEKVTAINLMKAATLAEEDPKASTALLNVVKEAHKIYNLYPQEEKTDHLNVGTININDRSQVLQQIIQQAKQEMPEEQIEKMVESAKIGELGVIPKKELFDNGNKETELNGVSKEL